MGNYKLINLDIKGDDRGSLIALEAEKNIPFEIKRVYFIFETKGGVIRGKHAHKRLKQLVICTSGNCKFKLDDGKNKEIVSLSKPNEALYIDNLIWREMFDFSPDCVLLILASEYYDENEYIRDYSTFIKEVNNVYS